VSRFFLIYFLSALNINYFKELYDDGLHADRYKDDGIYTREFSNFNMNGQYYARVSFRSNPHTVINMQKIVGQPEMEHFPKVGITNEINLEYLVAPIETMQRDVTVNPFMLTDYESKFLLALTRTVVNF